MSGLKRFDSKCLINIFIVLTLFQGSVLLAQDGAVVAHFLNRSSNILDYYWVDENGDEHKYGTVNLGGYIDQETYPGHRWRFKSGNQIMGEYTTGSEKEPMFMITNPDAKLLEFEDYTATYNPDVMTKIPYGFFTEYRPQTFWSNTEVYDLTTAESATIEFYVMCADTAQEVLVALSQTRMPYGNPEADALTLRFRPENLDIWLRTKFYENWPDYELLEADEVSVGTNFWQKYRIDISKTEIKVAIDGKYLLRADLTNVDFPHKGYFGFDIFGNPNYEHTSIGYMGVLIEHHGKAQPIAAQPVVTQQPVPEEQPATTSTGTRGAEVLTATLPNATLDKPGKYYAIVIAVQDYDDGGPNDLDYPIQDAQRVINTLTQFYTFDMENITFLQNPKKDQITDVFDRHLDKITENDNLLIFYAGHGFWDERMNQGFWLPADAEKNRRSRWLSNGTIRDYINGIRTRHTLLVTDACFSGGIFKTRAAFNDADRSTNELYKLPSRKALTSGTLKEVPDKSVFVKYLLKKLEDNTDNYLSSQALYTQIRGPVTNNSPNAQVPVFGVIRETGDEDGEFIFVRRK